MHFYPYEIFYSPIINSTYNIKRFMTFTTIDSRLRINLGLEDSEGILGVKSCNFNLLPNSIGWRKVVESFPLLKPIFQTQNSKTHSLLYQNV